MNPQDLLYTNQFINTDIDKNITISQDIENKNIEAENEDIKNTNQYLNNDMFIEDDINKKKNLFNFWPNNTNKNNEPLFSKFLNDVSKNDYNYISKKVVSLDSRDRDIKTNPYPNNFKIYLNKEFNKVNNIKLLDINIDNILSPINKYNNYISWYYLTETELLNEISIPNNYYIIPFINTYDLIKNKSIIESNFLFSNKNYSYYFNYIDEGFYNIDELKYEILNKMNCIKHNITENIVLYNNISLLNNNQNHNFYLDINVNSGKCKLINRAESINIYSIQTFISEEDINLYKTRDMFYEEDNIFYENIIGSTFVISIPDIINNNESIFTHIINNEIIINNIFPLILTNVPNIGGINNNIINFREYYYFNTIKSIRNKIDNIEYTDEDLINIYLKNSKLNINYYKYIGKFKKNNIYYSRFAFFTSVNDDITKKISYLVPSNYATIIIDNLNYNNYYNIPSIGRAILFGLKQNKDSSNEQFNTLNENININEFNLVNNSCLPVYSKSILELLSFNIFNNEINIISNRLNYKFIHDNYSNIEEYIYNINIKQNIIDTENYIYNKKYYNIQKLLPLVSYNNTYYIKDIDYIFLKIIIPTYSEDIISGQLIKGNSSNGKSIYINKRYTDRDKDNQVGFKDITNNLVNKNTDILFAKIKISPVPYLNKTEIIYGNFNFSAVIDKINELQIQILSPSGEILDIKNDFDLTIEIEEYIDILKDTLINSKTGKIHK